MKKHPKSTSKPLATTGKFYQFFLNRVFQSENEAFYYGVYMLKMTEIC
jgi:hypothetical protein